MRVENAKANANGSQVIFVGKNIEALKNNGNTQANARHPGYRPDKATNTDSNKNCWVMSERLRSEASADADFMHPFANGNQQNVHDDDAADQQRNGRYEKQHAVQRLCRLGDPLHDAFGRDIAKIIVRQRRQVVILPENLAVISSIVFLTREGFESHDLGAVQIGLVGQTGNGRCQRVSTTSVVRVVAAFSQGLSLPSKPDHLKKNIAHPDHLPDGVLYRQIFFLPEWTRGRSPAVSFPYADR